MLGIIPSSTTAMKFWLSLCFVEAYPIYPSYFIVLVSFRLWDLCCPGFLPVWDLFLRLRSFTCFEAFELTAIDFESNGVISTLKRVLVVKFIYCKFSLDYYSTVFWEVILLCFTIDGAVIYSPVSLRSSWVFRAVLLLFSRLTLRAATDRFV